MENSNLIRNQSIKDPWKNVSKEDWNSWTWQLKNRINSLEKLEPLLDLTEEERSGCLLSEKKTLPSDHPILF